MMQASKKQQLPNPTNRPESRSGMGVTLSAIWQGMGADASMLFDGGAFPTGAATDNRAVKPGMLFFCIRGERADGHDFAQEAVRAGAMAVIGERDPFNGEAPVPFLLVEDTVKAMGRVAAMHRDAATAKVIAVTGTAGKTSVKECLAAILSARGKTARNPRNLNNQIGLPLSMCNAPADAEWWVMEAGISRDGDMDDLGTVLRPDIALVLNAADGHLEGLGDKGVAWHKARLLDWLRPGGIGVVSADYHDLLSQCREKTVKMVYFSAGTAGVRADVPLGAELCDGREKNGLPIVAGATFLGPAVHNSPDARFGRYAVSCGMQMAEVAAPFQGTYGAENVAAMAAVCYCLGLSLEDMAEELAKGRTEDLRFRQLECELGLVIDDSYNANPLSMGRMVEAACTLAATRQEALLLILGEMGELGEMSAVLHRQLGRDLAASSPLAVFWKGGQAGEVREGLEEKGFAGPFRLLDTQSDLPAMLAAVGFSRGVILVKGSRANELERVAEELTHISLERTAHAL